MTTYGQVHPACQCVCTSDPSFAERHQEKQDEKKEHDSDQLLLATALLSR
jgi:hypothetical protein